MHVAISKITISDFTVFNDVIIELSNRVNVFVGENGTGKTHLLKLLYAGSIIHKKEKTHSMKDLFGYVPIVDGMLFHINDQAYIYKTVSYEDSTGTFRLIKGTPQINITINRSADMVFIPTKDILSHSKGLIPMTKKYSREMPFDKTYLDIIEKASQWKLDSIPDIAKSILPILEREIGGKVLFENDTFYTIKDNGTKVSFDHEAEGFKKLGLLWQLLMNESITENTILLWDEPESNINPKLIPDLVEIILELSRNGVQIFMATHDYFLPKYVEVLAKESDDVAFHSLYMTDDGVKCETSDKFTTLRNNDILEEKVKLYEAEVEKVMQ